MLSGWAGELADMIKLVAKQAMALLPFAKQLVRSIVVCLASPLGLLYPLGDADHKACLIKNQPEFTNAVTWWRARIDRLRNSNNGAQGTGAVPVGPRADEPGAAPGPLAKGYFFATALCFKKASVWLRNQAVFFCAMKY